MNTSGHVAMIYLLKRIDSEEAQFYQQYMKCRIKFRLSESFCTNVKRYAQMCRGMCRCVAVCADV